MTVLDVAIVNVALPSLGKDLSFSRENLQWVITAYGLTFGGFLLLGGRAADLLGRRRVFMVGTFVFTASSLIAGLATSEGIVDVARRRYVAAGAVTVTAGLIMLVYAISKAPDVGWGTGRTIGLLAGSAALLALFLAIETWTSAPLMPLGIFRIRLLSAANIVG